MQDESPNKIQTHLLRRVLQPTSETSHCVSAVAFGEFALLQNLCCVVVIVWSSTPMGKCRQGKLVSNKLKC
jgi:hypothetical protein